MASDTNSLHMLFFPFMAPGHMLPMIDMAKLFAAHGARVTVLTTPGNAAVILPTVPNSVRLHTVPFPSAEFGLPDDCETRAFVFTDKLRVNFFKAICSLRGPFDEVLADLRPHCVVTDMFMPWTYHVAAARGIPRLIFYGTNYFALCASDVIKRCDGLLDEPGSSVFLPGFPHRIQMTKSQITNWNKLAGTPLEFLEETLKEVREVEPRSYGVVMNTFYELEPEYADYRWELTGIKSWHVGPVSLCNKEAAEKHARGGELPAASECLKWLDGKLPGSVVYTCFGSGAIFTAEQLREMAAGFEESGYTFIWVVRGEGDAWMPEGYGERIKGRGMVIRGWAPQLLILNHAAVGGFVTHCGWNSSLEAICAGVPMVTWPLYAEQFFNERLLVQVLEIGVEVGSKAFSFTPEGRPVVKAAEVAAAVRSVMGKGEEAEERRRRAKELSEMARRAVEEGGSSYAEAESLMQELMGTKEKQLFSDELV